MEDRPSSRRARARRELARVPGLHALARLVVETTRVCLRYRVTGLASEAGFFAVLSLPPLVLGLFGGVGYVSQWIGKGFVTDVTNGLLTYAERFLTPDMVARIIAPTINNVLDHGRADLISVGFVLSLWSGSRALNVFIDTISIMYGQSGVRGIVHTRALSFTLYVVGLLIGIIVIPLVLIGPSWLGELLPSQLHLLLALCWPVVVGLTIVSLTGLFQVAVPRRGPWVRDVPGAVLTLVIWLLAAVVVRKWLQVSVGGTSIYGPLSTPILLLIWFYFLAIAVLIGAAHNAAIRELWPARGEQGVRASARRAARSIWDQVSVSRPMAGGLALAEEEALQDESSHERRWLADLALAAAQVRGEAVDGTPAAGLEKHRRIG